MTRPLRAGDQVKFVICDRDDYEWAKRQVKRHLLAARCEVLFSPAWQRQDAAALADRPAHAPVMAVAQTSVGRRAGQVTRPLRAGDQVKFVICDRDDYEWAQRQVKRPLLAARCEVLFSPAWQRRDAAAFADWILADRLPVRLPMHL